MNKKIILALAILFFFQLSVQAQIELTLEQCIDSALVNNIGLKQLENSLEIAQRNFLQTKLDYLPSLNAGGNYGRSYGTTYDLNTFRRTAEATTNSSPYLSGQLVVFNGLSKHYNRKKSESDLMAAGYAIEKSENDLQTNVVLYFFSVIYGQENLKIAENRLALLEKQLQRANQQLEAGVATRADVFNLQSQVSSEKVNKINIENQLMKDMLTLIQTLELDPTQQYELKVPEGTNIMEDESLNNFENIFSYAVDNMPEIKEQQMKILSAQYATKSSRAMLMPSINLNGGINSFYSSNGIFDPESPNFAREAGYIEQLGENFQQNWSFNLNIPIFNQHRTNTTWQISKISRASALLELSNQRNMLRKKLQLAYLDVTAAKAKYYATLEQLKSLNESFNYAQSKYDAGLIDFYTYLEVLNNKNAAEIEILNAQYDYILKLKILDIYQGKELKF